MAPEKYLIELLKSLLCKFDNDFKIVATHKNEQDQFKNEFIKSSMSDVFCDTAISDALGSKATFHA